MVNTTPTGELTIDVLGGSDEAKEHAIIPSLGKDFRNLKALFVRLTIVEVTKVVSCTWD